MPQASARVLPRWNCPRRSVVKNRKRMQIFKGFLAAVNGCFGVCMLCFQTAQKPHKQPCTRPAIAAGMEIHMFWSRLGVHVFSDQVFDTSKVVFAICLFFQLYISLIIFGIASSGLRSTSTTISKWPACMLHLTFPLRLCHRHARLSRSHRSFSVDQTLQSYILIYQSSKTEPFEIPATPTTKCRNKAGWDRTARVRQAVWRVHTRQAPNFSRILLTTKPGCSLFLDENESLLFFSNPTDHLSGRCDYFKIM